MKRYVIVDLDGTITVDEKAVPYAKKRENTKIISAINAATQKGLGIMVMTARGMRTYKGVISDVEEHVRPGVVSWLDDKDVNYEQLHVGKPWCGPRGYYVDDRNLHLEEFYFRFCGPFSGYSVDVYAEGPVADSDHQRIARVERWLQVNAYRYQAGPQVEDKLIGEPARPADWVLRLQPGSDPAAVFASHHAWIEKQPPSTLVYLGEPRPDRSRTSPFVLGPREKITALEPTLQTAPSDAIVLGVP